MSSEAIYGNNARFLNFRCQESEFCVHSPGPQYSSVKHRLATGTQPSRGPREILSFPHLAFPAGRIDLPVRVHMDQSQQFVRTPSHYIFDGHSKDV